MPHYKAKKKIRHLDLKLTKKIREFNKEKAIPSEDIINQIQKFGFNEGQLRLIILILSILQIRGKPRDCLETLMKDWKFPEYKLDPANSARYYFLAWLYHLPSQIIYHLIKNAIYENEVRNFLNINDISNDKEIKELLEKIGIPNNSDSLPNSCLNYKRYIFLYEFFNLTEMKMTVDELESYPNGRKYNQAEQITFHTNLSPIDIVEKMSDNSLFKKQEYFIRAYSLDKDLSDKNIENFRNLLKEAMIKRGEGRTEDLWADPFVWGEKIKAEDDHICDSKWEKNIDDFLFHNNILHEKPQSAMFDQYYSNRKMYPDWIVNGVMIELFGATYLEGYEEKIEYKKKNNKIPLICISKEDYENNLWENKLRRKLDFLS